MANHTKINNHYHNVRKLSRKTALSLGMTLAASMAVSATVQAAAPIVVTQVEHGSAGFATNGNTTTVPLGARISPELATICPTKFTAEA